jgi:tetratricopeptide (TPR) repeat protein
MPTSGPPVTDPSSHQPRQSASFEPTIACAVAVLLAGFVYLNALDNPFVYDDYRLIVENRSLHNPFNLAGLYFQNATRPLVNASYAIDRALWGPSPLGFRAVNVALHAVNVALLYLLAWRLTEDWLPYVPLGEALHNVGRHDEAAAAFLTAIRLRPQEEPVYGKLGVCLIEAGRFDDAAVVFEELRGRDPESGAASYGFGVLALAEGRPETARQHLTASLERGLTNIAARQALAVLEENFEHNPEAALRYCEEIRRMAPDTPRNDECIQRNRVKMGMQQTGPSVP